MILYAVNYCGPSSNYDWSIVTIHKTIEGAKKAMKQYRTNMDENNPNNGVEYCIIEIYTDSDYDCIYDYTDVDDMNHIYENSDLYD